MANRRVPRGEHGAAQVELAITLSLFFALIFAIIEFSLMIYSWSSVVEATRHGARWLVVNEPVAEGVRDLDCPTDTTVIQADCSSGCDGLLDRMNGRARMVQIAPENVVVTYRCSGTAYPGRPADMVAAEVSVSVTGLNYNLIMPRIVGLQESMTLPPFTTTKVAEDMATP